MKLRELKTEDAPRMLAWMHDVDVVRYMGKDFCNMTIDDCMSFIDKSQNKERDIHLAVADERDAYHGTVSLKYITEGASEFAIVIDKDGQGTGLAQYAMKEIMRIGFEERKLDMIYWNVLPDNRRAVSFYDKEYERVDIMKKSKLLRLCRGGVPKGENRRIHLVLSDFSGSREEEKVSNKHLEQHFFLKERGVLHE